MKKDEYDIMLSELKRFSVFENKNNFDDYTQKFHIVKKRLNYIYVSKSPIVKCFQHENSSTTTDNESDSFNREYTFVNSKMGLKRKRPEEEDKEKDIKLLMQDKDKLNSNELGDYCPICEKKFNIQNVHIKESHFYKCGQNNKFK